MKLLPKLALGALGLLVVSQLIRPEKTNPPVTGDVAAPPEVAALLKRACYDCHSNTTTWPWYSHVAPAMWLVTHHVNEGRGELNFSAWNTYEPKKQAHKLEECEELVQSGDMPMPGYVALHAEAKLSAAEKAALLAWFKAARQPPAPPAAPAPQPVPDVGDAGAPAQP